MPIERIRVLVASDFEPLEKIITEILTADSAIDLIGGTRNGTETLDRLDKLQPDVILLDVAIDARNGPVLLRRIMRRMPKPVVVIGDETQRNLIYKTLDEGAADFIVIRRERPAAIPEGVQTDLLGKIHAAANPAAAFSSSRPGNRSVKPIAVAIGSSTGGPKALERLFSDLPPDLPAAILIAQHLPNGFSGPLVERLSKVTAAPVKEAADGDPVRAGQILVAPGGLHMVVTGSKTGGRVINLLDCPPAPPFRPSINKLMTSVADIYQKRGVGVILSGMGSDGLIGMENIWAAGGPTIVQDKETSAVFGMPGSVAGSGLADRVLPIEEIAEAIRFTIHKMDKDHGRIRV